MCRRLLSVCTLVIGLLVSSTVAIAQDYLQPQNNVWVFGKRTGWDFSQIPPAVIPTALPVYPYNNRLGNYSACVSDAQGDLLFYTEGNTIWGKDHRIMPNGRNLSGLGVVRDVVYPTSPRALIVPKPGSAFLYYVFSVTTFAMGASLNCAQVQRLSYCVVDMRLNNGLGDVVQGQKAIGLDSPVSGWNVVRGDDCNVWLLTHARDTNLFKAWNITDKGIDPNPVLSYEGYIAHPSYVVYGKYSDVEECMINTYYIGNISISPLRNRIVYSPVGTDEYGTYMEFFDFNPATGKVSNMIHEYYLGLHAHMIPEGGTFSPDGTRYYSTMDVWMDYSTATGSIIGGPMCQFDMTVTPPALQYLPLNSMYPASNPILARDGKMYYLKMRQPNGLYTAIEGDSVGVINKPNLLGAACDVSTIMPSNNDYLIISRLPRPVPVQVYDTIRRVTYVCAKDSILLQVADTSGTEYIWQDGVEGFNHEGAVDSTYIVHYFAKCNYYIDTFKVIAYPTVSVGKDTTLCNSKLYTINAIAENVRYLWKDGSTKSSYIANSSGAYYVTVSNEANCTASDTMRLYLTDITQNIGNDTMVCNNSVLQIVLYASTPHSANVLWSNGSSDKSITVADTGRYWVQVRDSVCMGSDTLHIVSELCDCNVFIPSVFSPNGDSKNDIFRAIIQQGCPVQAYELQVYDRWGKVVYISDNPSLGWDGKDKGVPAPLGVYMYQATMKLGSENRELFRTGDVTLVR